MRIAVPISNGQFGQHFGQSTGFWVCDAQLNPPALSGERELPVPDGGGCGVIPALLAQAGVQVVLAGGIGAGAVQNLLRCGIDAVVGVDPAEPRQLAMQFLDGRLTGSGQTCLDHEDHAQHRHGHGHEHGHRRGACHGDEAKK